MTTELEYFKELQRYYHNIRFQKQMDFYDRRIENDGGSDKKWGILADSLVAVSIFVAGVVTVIRSVSSSNSLADILEIALIVIPAVSAAALTLRAIHQYENTQYLFQQTQLRLIQLRREEPTPDDPDFEQKLKDYIRDVENAVAAENQQWIAYVADSDTQPDNTNPTNPTS